MMSSTATSRKQLLTASWVALIDSTIRRDAGVLVADGKIAACGDASQLRRDHPDAEVTELGSAIILPGLVNAHTHLELSSCAAGESPTSFVDWILSMPRRIGREPNQRADALFAESTRLGIEQCLRFGVTSVGDISQQMHVTRPLLRASPLRAISYGEVIGLGKRRSRFEELLPMAIDDSQASDRLTIGLTPHSPYTLEPDAIRRCVTLARQRQLPLAIHLAETPDEEEFLRSHSGPLREMWERLGSWEDFPGTFDGTPVQFAKSLGLLDYPTVLAHVNYCTDADLDLLAKAQATVVYCPRTHRYFNHPPHRWREMLSRGIKVVVGTDSCASSPDLNIVAELRLLHELAPEHAVQSIWKLATPPTPRHADFTVFDVSSDDPLRELLESDRVPGEVWLSRDGTCIRFSKNG